MRVVTRSTSPGSFGGAEGCCAATSPPVKSSIPIRTTNRFIEVLLQPACRLLLRDMRLGLELLVHQHGLLCVLGAPFAPVCDAELIVSVIRRMQVDRGFQILNAVFQLSF